MPSGEAAPQAVRGLADLSAAEGDEVMLAVRSTGQQPLRYDWLDNGKPPPINARAEALASSAMFRDAQRCLIPATGFYEWRDRQPMHVQLRDGQLFDLCRRANPLAPVWRHDTLHPQPTRRVGTNAAGAGVRQ